jgi:preprotein translocase subunit YajC
MNSVKKDKTVEAVIGSIIIIILLIVVAFFLIPKDKKEKKEELAQEVFISQAEEKKIEIEQSRSVFNEIKINNTGNLNLEIKKIDSNHKNNFSLKEPYKECLNTFVFHSKSKCKGL